MESIRERCFPAHMRNLTIQKCFGVPLSGQGNRHGSISFRSTQPDDFFDLFDIILLLKDLREVLTLRLRCAVDTFLLDIVQFDGESLRPLQRSYRQGT